MPLTSEELEMTTELWARFDEIKADTQVDAHIMNRESSCNTTHHPGCDCQVQRYIREKLDLIAIIDRLLAENKALVNERASLNSIVCGLEDESRDRLGDKIRLTNRLTELVEAGESVLAEVNFDDDRGAYIITEFVLLRLSEAVRKAKGEE